ncbi:MAG: hypothetical protein JEZ07_08360 [Phycisphaerae bacterium]|nr:hypothetical protein [Phycisphaerae bacterium]
MRRLFRTKQLQSSVEFLRKPLAVQMTDVHCHCLANMDDGPVGMDSSIGICQALVADGINKVVASPHQLGRYENNTADDIRSAVNHLNKKLKELKIDLEVLPGADVRVDERLVQMLEDDLIMTVADRGKYILLELPHEAFVDISIIVNQLQDKGITSVITHPERHLTLATKPGLMDKWVENGSILQITAGSLLGDFGESAKKAGWFFLQNYENIIVAGDVHDIRRRSPRMREAFSEISLRIGQNKAIEFCASKPLEIITEV